MQNFSPIFSFQAIVLGCFLLSRKTEASYQAALGAFRRWLGLNVFISLIMVDFETGLRNACNGHFPAARVTGCIFHYDRVRD